MDSTDPTAADAVPDRRGKARVVLAALALTFLSARVLVLLIMTRRVPDLFLHVGGTHVHHLNYGIALLSVAGAWLLFAPPARPRSVRLVAALYGVGLGLTFDEFGLWLHLGGGYWQRASYDAVVAVAALLGLLAFAPPTREWSLRRPRPRHVAIAAALLAAAGLFVGLLAERLARYGRSMGPWLEQVERRGPA